MIINYIARREFRNIARRQHVTEEEVMTRIQTAILKGIHSEDEVVRNEWKRIPCESEFPTPEELFDYLVKAYGNWNKVSSIWISVYFGDLIDHCVD